MVNKVNQNDFDAAVASGISVVDFNATWCGPCKMLAPVLEDISEEMENVNFFAVDVDDCPDLAKRFKIMSIPAVAVLKDGELAEMNVGFVPYEEMKAFIEKNL